MAAGLTLVFAGRGARATLLGAAGAAVAKTARKPTIRIEECMARNFLGIRLKMIKFFKLLKNMKQRAGPIKE
jgi:hypothetical protein